MPNINDYIEWRGDIKLETEPLNEIDNMILSRFSYMPLNKIEMTDEETIGSIATKLKKIKPEDFNISGDKPLADKIEKSERFKNLKITDYEENTDKTAEKQFAAITIHLNDDEIYVSYCGTDNSIVGWKEDFNLSFTQNVPAQLEGVEYLKKVAKKYNKKIHLGGHSKGGNVAIYSAIYAGKEIQEQIIDITNHDGPGFDTKTIETEEYKRILGKITTYIPQTSIIGRLLEHKEKNIIVKSTEKGIMQHDIYSWQVLGAKCIQEKTTTQESDMIRKIIRTWLEDTSPEQRKEVIDTIYSIIVSTNANTMKEISSAKMRSLGKILRTYNKLNEKEKKIIIQVFLSLGTATKQNLKNNPKDKPKKLNKQALVTKKTILTNQKQKRRETC